MPKHARCAVGFCDNDKRYPDFIIKKSHVEELKFHKWPKDPQLAEVWRKQVAKGRSDEFHPTPGSTGTFVCSNHFREGKRTLNNPETDYPSIYLTSSDFKTRPSPKKRKSNRCFNAESSSTATPTNESDEEEICDESDVDLTVRVSMRFEQLTRESDVRVFTGLPSTEAFKCVFDHLMPRAQNMQYWRGIKQTARETPVHGGVGRRPEPSRKLDLPQEMLMTLMKLKLALLIDDLAFRFMVSSTTASSIFITWVKLMSKELSVLIIWPSRQQVKQTLPACFKKPYPKVRCIIDCFECFTETPSGLDLAATLWSEYKRHYTYKVLVAITPTGAISYVSPSYGGRASDVFIVRDSGFLKLIEPYDEVMADRGFKIREDLMMSMATLCIPPSCAASMQMLPSDVRKTSSIANVRIYVEQAIGRLRVFRILKYELSITLLPLVDDIVRVCCALCNLLPPLCE